MNTDLRLAPKEAHPDTPQAPGTLRDSKPGLLGRAVLKGLAGITRGRLILHEGTRRHEFGPGTDGPTAEIEVRDSRFWSAIGLRGSVGAGEAYAHQWWTSPDPVAVVRLLVRNIDVLDSMESGLSRISRPFLAAFHKLRSNSVDGAKDNIAAHYDLSNEFFELFLDPTMTYSCGIFENEHSTLEEASIEKIDRLCRKLELKAGERLVEIGTGWGAFALHAAREYGVHVTTTTISERQHELAERRIREAGLEDQITLLKEDYRKLPARMRAEGLEPFDKLVSVEMIEAVGHQYFDSFFKTCGELLKSDGRAAIQVITIADQRYEQAKNAVDFIQRYIFPGSCIPSVTALLSAATRASDLRVVDVEDIGAHYVPTLAAWRQNLLKRWDEARELGLDDTFLRLFEFYFVYCEGGFAERQISDVHLVFDRVDRRPAAAFTFAGR
ncbi:MAG: cyclopropane-fatty-acyl-phospholipid synthase [Planctomycetota bacterium]|jgi:cyclopropane-fatty-acyl-phospholipid synthase